MRVTDFEASSGDADHHRGHTLGRDMTENFSKDEFALYDWDH